MRLAALIVTWNRLEALKQSLPRMLAEEVDRVLVVDNASTDGTGAWLATLDDPRLEVLTLPENTGGAGGFAAGVEALVTSPAPPDWLCLLDDDAWPEPGAMAAFRARTPDGAGGVAAAVRYPGGAISEMNRPGLNPFWHARIFLRALTGGRGGFHLPDTAFEADAPPVPVDTASFVGFFVSLPAVRKAGLPEAGRFIYGDDLLYALKLRRAGETLVLDPAIRFVHDCGTMGEGFHYRPLWKIYYHARNGVDIAWRAAGPVVFPAALTYYVALWWRRSRYCPEATRATYRRLMWAGVRDGLLRRQGRNDAVHEAAALAQDRALR